MVLAGCVQPDAPLFPGGAGAVGLGTPIFPPTYTPGGAVATVPIFQTTPNGTPAPTLVFPTQNGGVSTVPPIQTLSSTPIRVNTPLPIPVGTAEPAQFIWRFTPVGPEQVAIMFFINPAGVRCARYIYRSKVTERCPQAGQTIVTLAGVEAAADGRQYTIIAGRTLSPQIRTVTIQFRDNTSLPIPVDPGGGYVSIIDAVKQAFQAVPIDEGGNLVGSVVPVT